MHVVLVYDDFDMAVHGKRICDLMAKELGTEEQIDLAVWRFDLLLSPDLVRAAVRQSEVADLIILASRGRNVLPIQVKGWLEQWPTRRKVEGGALVAVFDPAASWGNGSSEAELALRGVAARAGMDFFCAVLDPFEMPTLAGETQKRKVNTPATMTAATSEARNPRFCSQGWGLYK